MKWRSEEPLNFNYSPFQPEKVPCPGSNSPSGAAVSGCDRKAKYPERFVVTELLEAFFQGVIVPGITRENHLRGRAETSMHFSDG